MGGRLGRGAPHPRRRRHRGPPSPLPRAAHARRPRRPRPAGRRQPRHDTPRLADGTPLSADDLLRLAVDAFIRAVVVDAAGRPVAITRRQRLYTGPLREVLLTLTRTCSFPGCDIPAQRCEVDHIEPWRHTRQTTGPNGWPLCDRHQKVKEAGFTPHRHPDGTTHWTRPDGTLLE